MIPPRFAASIVAAVFLLPSAYGECLPSFAAPASFPAGNQPRTLVVANLNRDAYSDLVVGSWDYNGLPVAGLGLLAGGPNGRLELTDLLYDGHQVVEVVAGDFDGDGDDDVAFLDASRGDGADGGDGTVRMLRNNAGTFVESASFVVPPTASFEPGLGSGDFNGDGRVDVVFLSQSDAFVFVSRADGAFERKTFGEGLDVRPLVADLDGDGKDELITGRRSKSLTTLEIFSGDPAAGLVRTRQITASASKYLLAAGDFDGDGAIDLAVLGDSPAEFLYAAGTATAVTLSPELYLPGSALMVADLDGDGVDDLASNGVPEVITTAFGRRDRTMVPGDEVWLPGRNDAAFGPSGIAMADFDLDGDIDVVAAESSGVVLLKNAGDGSLQSPRFSRYGVLAVGDFNNDGRDDVLDEYGVTLAAPDGSIATADAPSFPYEWAGVADFNRDGSLDAIYYTEQSPTYIVRLGNGDGTLREQELPYQPKRRAEAHFIADLNGDGIPDFGQANNSSNGELTIAIGNGDGTFQAPVVIAVAGILEKVVPGDFNGDGSVDLVITRVIAPSAVVVLLNDGTGNFDRVIDADEVGASTLAAGDFNGDGLADIVTGEGSAVRVQLSEGHAFTEPVTYGAGTSSMNQITVRDFNHDGHLDLLVTDGPTSDNVANMGLLPGDGKGGFGPLLVLRAAKYDAAHVGDFNGDGQLDLLDNGFVRLGSCAPVRRRAAGH
jgi:hypothetical protein